MLYLDKYNEVQFTKDPNEVLLFSLLQELKLFKGENPLNQEAGIDYLKVFNFQAFLQMEAMEVLNRYADKFDTLELGEVSQNEDIIEIPLYVRFKDGTVRNETLQVTA